ncbi:MAG TPA: hypothetical protein VN908_12650 [Gemmatimonadales bacterium]|nr:hypothetical protein [Gemmatimonadales bacterium]
MRRLLIPLAFAGAVCACSNAGGVDPDAIDGRELAAVRVALDSAFRHDPTLDRAFTGDSGLYVLMAGVVFPFIDRASYVVSGADTTRVVGIEVDIDATQGGVQVTSNFTVALAWNGYHSTTQTVDSVFFLLGAGRAPVNDSLWTRFTLDTAGTGTGFVIHQAPDSTVRKWLSRGGRLRTTTSSYGAGRSLGGSGTTFTVFRGTLNGDFAITARLMPDSSTTTMSVKDFGSGTRALKVKIRGTLP